MVTFILDTDALIKLAKAMILPVLADRTKCVVPSQVYNEVLKGKENMYEDAFIVEELIKRGKIKTVSVKEIPTMSLGKGESAALALFQRIKADAIISDDRKFLTVLEGKDIPFIIPTDVIAILAINRKISKQEANKALKRIQSIVRKENYQKAMEMIGGE